jgi:Neuraminidase (sialidase)
MLEFEGKGEAVNVSYSTDEGGTWTSMFNGIVGSDYSKIRIWKQIITDKIRFKFSGDVGGFSLRRIRLKLREESTW